MDSSKKIPSEIEEESPTSTLTTDSPKIQEEEKVNNFENSSSFSSNSSTSSASFGSMKIKKKTDDHPKLNKSRSYSNGASSIFRNLITCGAVDTDKFGIVPLRKNKTSLTASGEKTVSFSSEICKSEKLKGSQRIFGSTWNQQTNGRKSLEFWYCLESANRDGAFNSSKNKSEFGSRRSVSANHKPINGSRSHKSRAAFRGSRQGK
ncbi:uncharacterized protein LOC132630565 [Lycium barbarum]|uniref:uncharacterized protein LOC132630565 n=1 Tax=Lycium barbarum TaxID=112863 RepID=UPI00293F7114|nr:uncharacterized protein LOC132630565 [Lycium barbarum]